MAYQDRIIPSTAGMVGRRFPEKADSAKRKSKETDITEEMIKKHCGTWKDSRSAEEIINDIMTNRTGSKDPLSFD